ncbi:MAG TPA: hypothetical protein VMF60_10450, partial [Acidimicrobiales bacterium]|nr:hypothetical protein [Acidimicrobiales bacterium]
MVRETMRQIGRGSRYRRAVAARVCTPVFEGPFDVLLQLVSDHKLDVYDIPLTEIVNGFLADLAARAAL